MNPRDEPTSSTGCLARTGGGRESLTTAGRNSPAIPRPALHGRPRFEPVCFRQTYSPAPAVLQARRSSGAARPPGAARRRRCGSRRIGISRVCPLPVSGRRCHVRRRRCGGRLHVRTGARHVRGVLVPVGVAGRAALAGSLPVSGRCGVRLRRYRSGKPVHVRPERVRLRLLRRSVSTLGTLRAVRGARVLSLPAGGRNGLLGRRRRLRGLRRFGRVQRLLRNGRQPRSARVGRGAGGAGAEVRAVVEATWAEAVYRPGPACRPGVDRAPVRAACPPWRCTSTSASSGGGRAIRRSITRSIRPVNPGAFSSASGRIARAKVG